MTARQLKLEVMGGAAHDPHASLEVVAMNKQKGFTVIELMVTVAIVAILAAVAVPSMRDFLRRARASTMANEMLTAFTLARSEAIRRNGNVTICPTNAAQTDCGSSWNDGFMVFTDGGTAGTYESASDVILGTYAKAPSGTVFAGGASPIARATFAASGMRRSYADASYMGTCMSYKINNYADSQRSIQLTRTGTVKIGYGACP
jgi:type IV fimbrial biogenesis protein FimT